PLGPNVLRHLFVELRFFGSQFVPDRFCEPLLEQRLLVPVDHLFLQATQEEAVARLGDRPLSFELLLSLGNLDLLSDPISDVLVLLKEILVKQEEQTAKGVLAPAMWRRCQEKKMVRLVGQSLHGFV